MEASNKFSTNHLLEKLEFEIAQVARAGEIELCVQTESGNQYLEGNFQNILTLIVSVVFLALEKLVPGDKLTLVKHVSKNDFILSVKSFSRNNQIIAAPVLDLEEQDSDLEILTKNLAAEGFILSSRQGLRAELEFNFSKKIKEIS